MFDANEVVTYDDLIEAELRELYAEYLDTLKEENDNG